MVFSNCFNTPHLPIQIYDSHTSGGPRTVTLLWPGDLFHLELPASGFYRVTGTNLFYLYATLSGARKNSCQSDYILIDFFVPAPCWEPPRLTVERVCSIPDPGTRSLLVGLVAVKFDRQIQMPCSPRLSDASLGTRPQESLAADEDIKKPNEPNQSEIDSHLF